MTIIRKGTISEALSRYLDAGKKPSLLIGPLEKHLLVNRPPSDRDHHFLHPSEVAAEGWCPRYAQMVMEDRVEVVPETYGHRMLSIFEEGHAIHAKWQKWLGDMGVLYGLWRCVACNATDWSLGVPEDLCGHPLECVAYAEVPLQVGIWSGHADGIIRLPESPEKVLEVKSVGTGTIRASAPEMFKDDTDLSKLFRRISQPFPAHQRQVQIYLELRHRIVAARGGESLDGAIVIYECKADQSPKEFVIQRDSSHIMDLLDWADEIEALLHSGELISCPYARGKCSHDHD